MSKLSEKIKRYRESKGLSPADLARKSGTSPANISRYESGTVENPSAEVVAKIAKGLGVSPGELLGEEITYEDVLRYLERTHLTDDEKALLESFRSMERIEQLGVLAFLIDGPVHKKNFREALLSLSAREQDRLARKFSPDPGAVGEEN